MTNGSCALIFTGAISEFGLSHNDCLHRRKLKEIRGTWHPEVGGRKAEVGGEGGEGKEIRGKIGIDINNLKESDGWHK